MNFLNFDPLHDIVIGLFDLDWAIKSVGGTVASGRSFRGSGMACRPISGFLRTLRP